MCQAGDTSRVVQWTKRESRNHRSACLLSGAALLALASGCATAENGYNDGVDTFADGGTSGGRADASSGLFPDAGPLSDASIPVSADAGSSTPDAATSCSGGQINLLANGNFDQGPGVWVESSGGGYSLIVDQSETGGLSADSGTYLGWLGGYSPLISTATDLFYQDVNVPAGTTSLSFSGVLLVDSAEGTSLPFDTLDLELVNPGTGSVLESIGSWSNMDKGTTWAPQSAALSGSYAGQTVRLRFTASLDFSNNTSFLMDTLALTANCQ